jgi:hypothetical protein
MRIKPDISREAALAQAWDFLEHWDKRLTAPDGPERLEEFYGAMFKFLKRYRIFRHDDVGKLEF